jgi:hypothetical protein
MKLELLILEENGEIDTETVEKETVESAFVHAVRFVSLFHNDSYKRVARAVIDGRIRIDFDGLLNKLTIR